MNWGCLILKKLKQTMNSDERKEFILSPHHIGLGANRLQLMEMTPKDTRKRHPKVEFGRAGVNSKNRSGLHYKAKKQLEHSVGTADPTLEKKNGRTFQIKHTPHRAGWFFSSPLAFLPLF